MLVNNLTLFLFAIILLEVFGGVIKHHKNLELLNVLKEHVYSFNNSLANERINEICYKSINFRQ